MARPWLLGIEIGGTKLQVGLGRGDGTIAQLRKVAVEPARGASGILEQVRREADHVAWLAETTRDQVVSVGIGFGGPVDAEAGVALTSFQVPGWDDFPLADWVRRELGVEHVAIQNDADTAGLGEDRFGAGVGRSPLVYVTIGSGIGGGLVLDGRIYRGSGRGAMEIGHLPVIVADLDGDERRAELEQVASGWSIAAAGRRALETTGLASTLADLCDGDPAQVTAEVVAFAAGLGDKASRHILDAAVAAMAQALAATVTLLAPQRIILGGGVSQIGDDLWFAPIRRALDPLVLPPFRGTFDLVPARLGQDVVVHGALALARDLIA
ncbi:MAG TPA: ROK family protein [Isosphaeraceae bacterium]|jgi:glucokinase|nr:ROK family protein [Isosphaeraceae bacterium]